MILICQKTFILKALRQEYNLTTESKFQWYPPNPPKVFHQEYCPLKGGRGEVSPKSAKFLAIFSLIDILFALFGLS